MQYIGMDMNNMKSPSFSLMNKSNEEINDWVKKSRMLCAEDD